MTIAFQLLSTPLGTMRAFHTPKGLSGLYFVGQRYERTTDAQDIEIPADDARAQRLAAWLRAYFAGEPECYPDPLWGVGTPLQQAVWAALKAIPFGATATYGDIARAVGKANAARAVGAAIGRNPLTIIVPCHRVLGTDGQLTGYAGGLDRKQALLAAEGAAGVKPRLPDLFGAAA